MGSKCCDCKTNYWLEEKTVILYARPVGSMSITPSKPTPSNKYCRVILRGSDASEYGWGQDTLTNSQIYKRQIFQNPQFTCDCLNVNGGIEVDSTLMGINPQTITSKTRTSKNWYWEVTCPSFPGLDIQQIPCVGKQKYDFVAETKTMVFEYEKEHKCGPGCPGNGYYVPIIMDKEIPIFTELYKMSYLYQWSS